MVMSAGARWTLTHDQSFGTHLDLMGAMRVTAPVGQTLHACGACARHCGGGSMRLTLVCARLRRMLLAARSRLCDARETSLDFSWKSEPSNSQ